MPEKSRAKKGRAKKVVSELAVKEIDVVKKKVDDKLDGTNWVQKTAQKRGTINHEIKCILFLGRKISILN